MSRRMFAPYSSMYFDEDGHLAHEFYREEKVTLSTGVVRSRMKKIFDHLIPQVRKYAIALYPLIGSTCTCMFLSLSLSLSLSLFLSSGRSPSTSSQTPC